MHLHPDTMALSIPPPQAVVNQRPWWLLLVFILGVTLILRVMSLDMLGGLLCALMVCLCTIILRDGMRELPKFSLLFGLLCGINFVFYAMPVLGYIVAGKSERRVQPLESFGHGKTQELTYTLTVKTMPFFDRERGFLYNAQSFGELMMPLAMLLGTYLGVSSHYEFQDYMEEMIPDDDDDELGRSHNQLFADGDPAAAARSATYGAIFGAATGGVPPCSEQVKPGHKAFAGESHKLEGI